MAGVLSATAAALYFAAGAALFAALRGDAASQPPRGALALAALAVLVHAGVLYASAFAEGRLNIALPTSVSLAGWAASMLFLAAALKRPTFSLGIVVLPLAGVAALLGGFVPGQDYVVSGLTPAAGVHMIVAVLAYACLTLAVAQAVLLAVQEHQLHANPAAPLLQRLPALETMESVLFRLILAGFVLLTVTVLSGTLFSEQVFGRPFVLSHHVVLSVLAWLTFAVLLAGRRLFGWRGRSAIRWTLTGFVLLALAYFGTRIVLEVVLGR